MAWHLFCAKPLPEQVLMSSSLTLRTKFYRNLKQNTYIFLYTKAFKMSTENYQPFWSGLNVTLKTLNPLSDRKSRIPIYDPLWFMRKLYETRCINSLLPGDMRLHHQSWSTSVKVMAWSEKGVTSIWTYHLMTIEITISKTRQSHDCLIFIMEIPYPERHLYWIRNPRGKPSPEPMMTQTCICASAGLKELKHCKFFSLFRHP